MNEAEEKHQMSRECVESVR